MFYIKKSVLMSSILLLSLFATGCAKQKYVANPIDQAKLLHKLENKNVEEVNFKRYLIQQGYSPNQLPFISWGLDELTYCALFHHTKLSLAKAQLALANVQIDTAALHQNPVISGESARSNQKNNDIKPWALGLNVQIPIEITNKRNIRIEQAQQLAQAAKLDVADVAWQLRAKIAKDLLRYYQNTDLTGALKSELETQIKIVDLLKKRAKYGTISNTDLTSEKLKLLNVQQALRTEQTKMAEIRSNLAADVGLSTEKFKDIKIKPHNVNEILAKQNALLNTAGKLKSLQSDALLNRIDVRRSLAKYGAAESAIKLEVAKQTPDIVLTPGFAFEFGDSIWSLGFSTLLSLLNKNETLINEALMLREIEGAQFEALQASIIASLSHTIAEYQSNNGSIKDLNTQIDTQLHHTQKLKKQFAAGLIDRLVITQNQANELELKKQLLTENYNVLASLLAIEEIIQKPVF